MDVYEKSCGAITNTPGLSLVKLRYEHVYLTSFSKMRVDLAAQVCIHVYSLCFPCVYVCV